MPASNLIERVAELIASGEELVPDSLRPDLAELQLRLREPVRVAVVGKVSAGKSTMVNALLGQRVAPTDVSECTRLVTWFHYGHPPAPGDRAQSRRDRRRSAHRRRHASGHRSTSRPKTCRALHCYLANDLLKWMTLIDTPGIGSVHQRVQRDHRGAPRRRSRLGSSGPTGRRSGVPLQPGGDARRARSAPDVPRRFGQRPDALCGERGRGPLQGRPAR